ncbi:hypothetical protein NECID01_1540 [Nematocida sp. AWRm77]|nr:hypothetical protein NECID01_1540 [Nematocida sp. AWRm77]
MLEHFHFAEQPSKKKVTPHLWVGFEETLSLPNVEEVDSLPDFEPQEPEELLRLERVGAEILTRIYSGEKESVTNIICKTVSSDTYRV